MKKIFPFVFVISLFLSLRIPGLGYDIANTDSPRWHHRSEKFLEAIKAFDFKNTYQHYQPGITFMWINAFVKQAAFSYQLTYTDNPKTTGHTEWFPIIHGLSKGAIVAILAALLAYQVWILTKLFYKKTAIIYAVIMSIEPFLIGIDRFFHLTSLETYLAFSSFLTVLLWSKNKNVRLLTVAGILFGLAALTKTSALIALIPILFIFIASKRVKPLAIFSAAAVVIFVLLFPALWVEPIKIIKNLLGGITGGISKDVRDTSYFGNFFYAVMLAFKLSSITLILFVLSFWKTRKEKKLTPVFIYFIAFFVIFSLSVKKIDRYVISFVPPITLIIAFYVSKIKKLPALTTATAYTIFTLWLVSNYYPVYSAYYSPLVGGVQKALETDIYGNKGEYFAQAAYYLNQKGKDKYTYMPGLGLTFSQYYKGHYVGKFDSNVDYTVTAGHRFEKYKRLCPTIEKEFGSKLDKVVFVLKCK